jgi:inhibitor of cysteine peptidase
MGTIRHIDLEGGFYGLEADDGTRLDPVNLPEEFQKDGLRVKARVERLKDRVSFHMWGRLVRILEIERL